VVIGGMYKITDKLLENYRNVEKTSETSLLIKKNNNKIKNKNKK
jgi:hypothetical protein